MAIHSSILAWRIPWTEKSGGYSPVHGVARVRHKWHLGFTHTQVTHHLSLGYYRKTDLVFVVVVNFSCAEIHTKSAEEITQRGYVNN